MTSLIVFGIVAIFAGLVYFINKSGQLKSDLEHEKATSGEAQKVADNKVQSLNETVLELDAQTRAQEREQERQAYEMESPHTRSRIGFYPKLHEDKDPNDLN